jgi:hypothetical protein
MFLGGLQNLKEKLGKFLVEFQNEENGRPVSKRV